MEDLSKDKDRNIHLQIEKGVFIFVENYNVKQQTGYRFTIEHFEDEKLTFKLLADRIELDTTRGPNAWKIINYTKRYINGLEEHIENGKSLDTTLNLLPTDLYKIKEDFEVMNFWELKEHINKERLKGSPGVVNYEVEMQKRLASPAAIIILTFIGAALSSRKVRGGIGMHLGLGIAITFSYILFMQFSTVFATFGNLSPVWAAWIPNTLYAILGVYLIIKAPK
jgi:lipopolysaccharide export system permease protein